MQISYYPDTDTLYIDLKDVPSVETKECGEDFAVDFDSDGRPVGIEIEHAKEKTDLSNLHTEGLPLTRVTYEPISSLRGLIVPEPTPLMGGVGMDFRVQVHGNGGSGRIISELLNKQTDFEREEILR